MKTIDAVHHGAADRRQSEQDDGVPATPGKDGRRSQNPAQLPHDMTAWEAVACPRASADRMQSLMPALCNVAKSDTAPATGCCFALN